MDRNQSGPIEFEALKQHITPVEAEDTMAEAGRKILLADFVAMLSNEAGSRAGEDIEFVHDMRVATRRMRSAFRLLDEYYKSKPIRPYVEHLRTLARHLGAVRDLDVMIDRIQKYQEQRIKADQIILQKVIDRLAAKRDKARKKLVALLDSPLYRKFVASFAVFLTHPGSGNRVLDGSGAVPHQVRHVLPSLIHEHLAGVRAYDNVLDDADVRTLHALRIEFKRLRYVVAYFLDVLGASGQEFIENIKRVQDHLGNLNDTVVAQNYLESLLDEDAIDAADEDTVREYIAALQKEREELIEGFRSVWERFNTRAVQRKLSDALLVLR